MDWNDPEAIRAYQREWARQHRDGSVRERERLAKRRQRSYQGNRTRPLMEDACRLSPVPAGAIREALRISGVPGRDAERRTNLTRGRLSAALQRGPLVCSPLSQRGKGAPRDARLRGIS